MVVVEEAACPESDGFASYGADGPDDAAAEPVVEPAISFGEHAGGAQFFVGESLGAQVFEEVVPAARGVSDAEGFGGGRVEASGTEKALCFCRAGRVEVAFKEFGGNFVGVQQAAAQTGFVPVAWVSAFIVQGVADTCG